MAQRRGRRRRRCRARLRYDQRVWVVLDPIGPGSTVEDCLLCSTVGSWTADMDAAGVLYIRHAVAYTEKAAARRDAGARVRAEQELGAAWARYARSRARARGGR